MKKVLLVLIALVMIVVDCEDASAKNNLLEELINVVGKTSTSGDFESVREILISFGYQESADEVTFGDNSNTYDAILSICEQEYGSYYGWTVSQRYQFDSLMVMLGQLPYCINLNPEQDNVDQSSALDIALSEIVQRYGDMYKSIDFDVSVSYCAIEVGSVQGMWCFGIEFLNGDAFSVHVLHGNVIHCTYEKRISNLESEYNELCDKRGAFFKWNLNEKVEYANSLPDKLLIAQAKNETSMSYDELVAISRYGFTMPTDESLQEEVVRLIAIEAVQAEYNLSAEWHANAEIYYSFFSTRSGDHVWRVIIWNTGNNVFPSGIVEMNSKTGEVIRIEKNGTQPHEYIPYLNRI